MQSLNWNDLADRAEKSGAGVTEVLPANTYHVRIASAEAKPTSNQKPMLKLRGKVVGGPYDGKTLWNQMVLSQETDVAVAIFLRHLDAYGLDKTYLAQGPTMDQIAAALVEREALWQVAVGSYQNRPKNEVKDTRPLPPGGGAPAAPVVSAAPIVPVPQPTPIVPVPAPAPVVPQPAPVPVPAPPVPAPAPVPVAPAPAAGAPPEPPF